MTTENSDTGHRRRKSGNITVNELLSAIGDTEYPQYILEAIGKVQEWMQEVTEKPEEPIDEEDIFASIFGAAFGENNEAARLFEKLRTIEDFADVVPNPNGRSGKPDTIIISITPPDFDSGIRTAIDYAAVFNRTSCKRVWIISDTFIFDEVIKFVPHVDALADQGIMLRYILVTPWGWVEMPLSGATASKHKFL
ncbi:MAG: hypothetical protein IJS39_05180 [Synergistaceae bacterium]|nr:hypothetical protein [Synergistaceae bacterium]